MHMPVRTLTLDQESGIARLTLLMHNFDCQVSLCGLACLCQLDRLQLLLLLSACPRTLPVFLLKGENTHSSNSFLVSEIDTALVTDSDFSCLLALSPDDHETEPPCILHQHSVHGSHTALTCA